MKTELIVQLPSPNLSLEGEIYGIKIILESTPQGEDLGGATKYHSTEMSYQGQQNHAQSSGEYHTQQKGRAQSREWSYRWHVRQTGHPYLPWITADGHRKPLYRAYQYASAMETDRHNK
jgi:hypothetical protein